MDFEIKNSVIGERGLFALKSYSAGETIFVLNGKILERPTRESIHIGNGMHIDDKYGKYINHSFLPTVWIDGKNVRALKEINCGDEITFDYNQSEINMACPFVANGIKVIGRNA